MRQGDARCFLCLFGDLFNLAVFCLSSWNNSSIVALSMRTDDGLHASRRFLMSCGAPPLRLLR